MKHSILCVDDEVDNVDALERLFRRKYNVVKATSGEQALQELKSRPVAVIISDQRMPGMSGVELLTKSIKLHPDAIRILLTGYADIESTIAAINSGNIYRYVTKPWDSVDLANAVDKAVERYEIGGELAEKNRALRLALEELRGLDEAKTQFMLLVNHELKTPLTAIVSFADLLRETRLDRDQSLYLSRILSSTQRLEAIVTDTLEFVAAETGQTKIELKSRKAKALFAPNAGELAPLLESRELTLATDIANASVIADEKSMRNIMQRLIHNALKFAEPGSEVGIIGRPIAGDLYRVTVHNRAPDINKQKLAQILKPFALNENALNHSTGTGMGLSICQALLRLHRTRLELSSARGSVEAAFSLPVR